MRKNLVEGSINMNPNPTNNTVRGLRVTTPEMRQGALEVLRMTYCQEKNWVKNPESVFPESDLIQPDISWFIVQSGGLAAGVLRVLYDPPIHVYATYGLTPIAKGLDVMSMVRNHRIAEVGRFAVLPGRRGNIRMVAELMRAAFRETVERNYTHYITDVFDGEKHSPLEFHTHVMGFTPVATHDTGELNCPNRRVTLVLDLREAFLRMQRERSWIYRFLTYGWENALQKHLFNSDSPAVQLPTPPACNPGSEATFKECFADSSPPVHLYEMGTVNNGNDVC